MDGRSLRRLLLEMACAAEPIADARLASCTPADWRAIAGMAAQHRLGPMLHARYGESDTVPGDARSAWRAAHRYWACSAMLQKLDLQDGCRLLAEHGFAPIALKGAFLAWHAYPQAALRPLRDLDLLVEAAQADDAFAALLAAGYRRDMAMEAHAGSAHPAATKHLDPLLAPRGTVIELHRRLWEDDGVLDHRLPGFDFTAIRSRAVTIDGIAYPAAEDMFVHLVVHAIYSHRLDCGPLLLWDLFYLLPHLCGGMSPLWVRARDEGWERGGALVIALLRRYFGEAAIPVVPGEPLPAPAPMIETAIDLLLQDLDTRRSAGVAATVLAGGRGALGRRFAQGRRRVTQDGQAQPSGIGDFVSWAASRFQRTVGELGRGAVRGQARGLADLSLWLGA